MGTMSDEYLIDLLDAISTQINRYASIFIFLFGVVGNILNICVLSKRTLRSNSCAWFFLIASIINLISILSGLITRMMNGWSIDPTETIDWICKLRAHLVFSTRTMELWLIALATIDRWLLSNVNARRRRMSTLKNAQRCTIMIIVFSILLYAQMFYCYEANLIDTPLKCYGKTITCRHVTDMSFCLFTIVIPLSLMILFGFMTISNLRQSQRRVQALTARTVVHTVNKASELASGYQEQKLKKKTDRSLLRMLFVEVILLTIFTLPLSIQKFYSSFSGDNKTPVANAINMFAYNQAVLLYFISNGMPFYIYTWCGGSVFRKAFYDFINVTKQKIMRR